MGMKNMVKKTIELDNQAIKKARKYFGVKTDKEAVNRALYLAIQEEEIIQAHQQLAGKLKLRAIYT